MAFGIISVLTRFNDLSLMPSTNIKTSSISLFWRTTFKWPKRMPITETLAQGNKTIDFPENCKTNCIMYRMLQQDAISDKIFLTGVGSKMSPKWQIEFSAGHKHHYEILCSHTVTRCHLTQNPSNTHSRPIDFHFIHFCPFLMIGIHIPSKKISNNPNTQSQSCKYLISVLTWMGKFHQISYTRHIEDIKYISRWYLMVIIHV